MPQLKPETISMTGLNLFQHLCNLARLATSALDNNASSCEVSKLQRRQTDRQTTTSASRCNSRRVTCHCACVSAYVQLCGMDQLWGIALRAQSADISRAAIQYINSYYINGEFPLYKRQMQQKQTSEATEASKSHQLLFLANHKQASADCRDITFSYI